ncbi:MAG: protease HtpX [Rhodanobacteraceae bacterium]|nr:protease HtpX [Rhodanobacteraceae bacterium]MBL0041830.1 protease HtpX [Xanthomonadales bacterium]MBP6079254.1 protease HtpX [Xanthomonadales bacterium]MBP7623112.1 protease HtpX [Xanthomonadales bacterium]
MLRIALFVGTNLAIMVLLGLLGSVFGLNRNGSLTGLLAMSAVIGMTGSFISLFVSKWMAKRSTGAQVITEPRSEAEAWLLSTVRRQAEQAGIGMPEVAIYEAPEMNAFATGWNRNDALVAVSTGLLRQMQRREVEAVLAHEVSHVANGDMVTLALIQGVLNTFVVFISNIVASIVSSALRRGDDDGPGVVDSIVHTVVYMALQIALGLVASIIVMWFSRRREFRADAGGASLAGRDSMVSALRRLAGDPNDHVLPDEVKAFGISGGKAGGLRALFLTHPPIADRIAALEQMPRTNVVG